MAALCQHKLLVALEQTRLAPETTRTHPPTQLEWTAGRRRGRMVLDVFTLNGDPAYSGPSLPLMLPGPPPCFTPTSYSPSCPAFGPPWGQQPFPAGVKAAVSHSRSPPRSHRRVLLRRGGVLDYGGAVGRVDSAEQVRGPGMEGAASTERGPVLPAHSPTKHLLQLPQPRAKACAPQRGGGEGQVGRFQTR